MVLTLTKSQKTVVDDSIPEWIRDKSWYAFYTHKRWYAASRYRGKIILLHRVIAGAKPNETVDHINMNTLDNHRENLRCCSYGDNNCNRGNRKGGTSFYKGVSWHERGNKWQVSVKKNGKAHWVGLFNFEEDAALAYNEVALRIHGQFAHLNKIGGQNG